jgi:hypothetical protein
MRAALLIIGIVICGLLAAVKIWGLVFIQFSIKQLIYVVSFGLAAVACYTALRRGRTSSEADATPPAPHNPPMQGTGDDGNL